jgi:hypothetical protein
MTELNKIELRLTDVNPPDPDPPRTIYRDIVNLPNPTLLGITIRYFNHDDETLYFQITGSGSGYTFNTVNLGSLASGSSAYYNLHDFASRARPSPSQLPNGEVEETIKLILKAYRDSGYTDLKWTYEREVTVHWLNSNDPSFTLDYLNNFDDGTVQGWAVANEALNASGYPKLSVVTDYVLTEPYSICMQQKASSPGTLRARLYKSFTTPNRDIIFAIMGVRINATASNWNKSIQIKHGDILDVYLAGSSTNPVPANVWMKIIAMLPKNTTVEVRVVHEIAIADTSKYPLCWLDDFMIMSK